LVQSFEVTANQFFFVTIAGSANGSFEIFFIQTVLMNLFLRQEEKIIRARGNSTHHPGKGRERDAM